MVSTKNDVKIAEQFFADYPSVTYIQMKENEKEIGITLKVQYLESTFLFNHFSASLEKGNGP